MKFSKTEFGYVAMLEPGEEILSSLSSFARAQNIGSAAVQGIGAAAELTIGYFDRTRKDYVKKTLEGEYEILSLSGNISFFQDEPWVHIHVIVAGPGLETQGGHLFSGKVTVTAELALTVSRKKIERKEHAETGFRYLSLDSQR
ncbi:MAG: DNA-binding protein [Candidatus Eiseniibacteriota bacterium]|nr:MAG: DNA-binding protein [Candidatus Eisenbacteria bacterium]